MEITETMETMQTVSTQIHSTQFGSISSTIISGINTDSKLEHYRQNVAIFLELIEKLIHDSKHEFIAFADSKENLIEGKDNDVDFYLSMIENLPLLHSAYQKTLESYNLTRDKYIERDIEETLTPGTPLHTSFRIVQWKLETMKAQ